jgi:hypothetical protein
MEFSFLNRLSVMTNKPRRYKSFFLFLIPACLIITMTACEENIDISVPASKPSMVMEGRIEQGNLPFLLLTRDQPFYSTITSEQLATLFIDSADVIVTDYTDTVVMEPINLSDLPEGVEPPSSTNLPVDLQKITDNVNLTVYVPRSRQITGVLGSRYKILAETDQFAASSTTKLIQPAANLDSVFFTTLDDPSQDTLVRVSITVDDPQGTPKYYRYFTKRNSQPFYAPLFGSVASDGAVDGKTFEFPINRAYRRLRREDIENITPFFERGDTVTVKLCAIEKEVYDFWTTLEDDIRNRGSPFGSATRIKSNVKGGRGIFAGYACDTASVIIPKSP